MAEGLASERETIGAAVAVFLTFSALFLFAAGALADRYPIRLIFSAGIALCTIGMGLLAVTDAPWQVIISYGIIFGIGAGLASPPPVGVMLTRRYPKKTGLANAVAIAGMGLGQLIIIGGSSFILEEAGWRFVFICLSLSTLCLMPLILWSLPKGTENDKQNSTAKKPSLNSFTTALKIPYMRLLLIVYAICGFQDFFVSTHIVAFALDQGIGTILSGNILAFMGLAGLLGVLGSGIWSDRSGPVPATIFCFSLRILIFILILSNKSPASVAIFSLLYGITFWMTAPLTVVFVRDAFGSQHLGALSGFVTMVHHIFGGFGAWVGARLFDNDGNYDYAFAIMMSASVAGMFLTMMLSRKSGNSSKIGH